MKAWGQFLNAHEALDFAIALAIGPTFASRDETAIAAAPAPAVVSVPVDAGAEPPSKADTTLEPLEAVADEIADAKAEARPEVRPEARPETRPEARAKRGEARSSDPAPRRQARTAPRPRLDPLRAVGRAVRVDKHLRKLF